jgi:glycine dehydrogenase subunit 1
MTYIPNTDKERAAMLKAIGVETFEDLICNIPPSVRFRGDLNIPAAHSEHEVLKKLRSLSDKNRSVSYNSCFIGAGAYDHFSPAIVDHVISRPEFYTAYTPYQAELSQGTLQAMYEFQTCVSMLAGLDIANASLYDGASAIAEAVLMASGINRKNRVLVSSTIHPDYMEVLKTYVQGMDIEIVEIREKNGLIDTDHLADNINEETSSVVIQNPNFYGLLEESDLISKIVKQYPKTLFIVSFNPISVGLLKSPGDYGADIAVAEGQSLGLPLNFGGPYIGLLATKNEFIRKIPGRMAGKTYDTHGKEGYVLALQTREQHIKRERATSNICTNQGLMAVAVLTYLAYMGKEGIAEVARQSYNKAHYLAEKIHALNAYKLKYKSAFFNEFLIESDKDHDLILETLEKQNILGGLNLKKYGKEGILIAVTEKRSKEELDKYISILQSI